MWREFDKETAGSVTRLFTGSELLEWRDGGIEYVRKTRHKEELPQPSAYDTLHLDLAHGTELARNPCGFSSVKHECITLEVPIHPYTIYDTVLVKSSGGVMRAMFDASLGLLISLRSGVQFSRAGAMYKSDTTYMLTKLTVNVPFDQGLFTKPATFSKEVKTLPTVSPDKINKQLAGKLAPDVELKDIQGNALKLSSFKGKTLLLDFWATWCGPCREDGPALDKLYKRYGGKNLAIIGISVDEERGVVQKFLAEHPHEYPIVLTTENELPSTYAVAAFPTYFIIDPDGKIVSAHAGEEGFSGLRHDLKKAGMEPD
jgi:thiol-disulfide isomerase/thioredoxin